MQRRFVLLLLSVEAALLHGSAFLYRNTAPLLSAGLFLSNFVTPLRCFTPPWSSAGAPERSDGLCEANGKRLDDCVFGLDEIAPPRRQSPPSR